MTHFLGACRIMAEFQKRWMPGTKVRVKIGVLFKAFFKGFYAETYLE